MTLDGDLQRDFQKPMATEQTAVLVALGVRMGWQAAYIQVKQMFYQQLYTVPLLYIKYGKSELFWNNTQDNTTGVLVILCQSWKVKVYSLVILQIHL